MRVTKTQLSLAFFLARLLWLCGVPWEGLVAYGDLRHYYALAALPGWPLVHYWAEYPPLFPWLAEGLYRLTGGQEVLFTYLLALLFSAAQALSLWLVADLAAALDLQATGQRTLAYGALTWGLLYTWGQFDPLVVALTLAGVWLWQRRRPQWAALSIALGVLGKWFPLLVLPAWMRERPRVAWRGLLLLSAVTFAAWGGAWLLSPPMTRASLVSQAHKGSWETLWALWDGNLSTGLLGPLEERLDPHAAARPRGAPAQIPPLLTLLPFGLLGLLAWHRFHPQRPDQTLAFIGFTWTLFLLWSPGYSPQWVLYLLPWMLLGLPWPRGGLFSLVLVGLNLVEWPLTLSRGLFPALYWIVPLRTALLLGLAGAFWAHAQPRAKTDPGGRSGGPTKVPLS